MQVQGTVEWFNVKKSFGFIAPDDGSEFVIVHHASIVMNSFIALQQGQRVEFKIVKGAIGREAQSVKPL